MFDALASKRMTSTLGRPRVFKKLILTMPPYGEPDWVTPTDNAATTQDAGTGGGAAAAAAAPAASGKNGSGNER